MGMWEIIGLCLMVAGASTFIASGVGYYHSESKKRRELDQAWSQGYRSGEIDAYEQRNVRLARSPYGEGRRG